MKRALAVLLIGLGMVGIATLAGRGSTDERFQAARKAVDIDCRAYRAQPSRRTAEVCRDFDPYGPKALTLYTEAKALLEHARGALARGETRPAESDLSRAVAITDDMDHIGTAFAQVVRGALLKNILDVAEDHRELDATRLLRDVHLSARDGFAAEALQHRWYLAHWNEHPDQRTRSASDLADALEEAPDAYRQMERALVERHDAADCENIARKHDLSGAISLCERYPTIVATATRLEAVQHGRLASAAR